jgi:asparagine synthase (glutamine-hydrolysing)
MQFYKRGKVVFMCGIAGIINLDKDIRKNQKFIADMTYTLKKRGPDAVGYYIDKHVLLGHRRLIVVDPTGGTQPMIKDSNNNTYGIVYNGELYNTEDLRTDLKKLGYTFESYSDTEVLLTSYIAWGTDCVTHINGIFSFAIWNEKEQTLFLCRDPLGVKPLYYTLKNGYFLFGSELKALLVNPIVEPIIDREGICEIMGLGPSHSLDNGVFKNIYQLPPAHYLIYNKYGFNTKEYWTLKSENLHETESQTIEHTRELLLDAIKRQLVADVPVCTFLSGGLDSSIISTIAAQEFKKNGKILNTFSIDYEDNKKHFKSTAFTPTSDDEWVDVMTDFLKTNHTKVILDNLELAKTLTDAVDANDLPGMADIDSSLYLFCREVRKKATVALSGECADEIFGGYPWFLKPELYDTANFPWSSSINERQNILSKDLQSINLNDYVQQKYDDTIKKVDDFDKRLFYLNVKWFMVTLLTRKDRMSMANSLEVRVPFADYRLVQYAYNIPSELKFYNHREKGLLRKSLEGLMPHDVIWRKKSPYPKTFDPRYTKVVQDIMRSILNDKNSPILQLVDEKQLRAIVETEGKSFGKPWYGQLMTGPQLIAYMIQIDIWMRKYNVKIEL